jgi:preprotein translocase subunit SecD
MSHPLIATSSKERIAVTMASAEEQDRAERLFRQRQEGTKALQEYRAKQEAIRNLTAKLRAERLAREAINGKPKSERKKATRP